MVKDENTVEQVRVDTTGGNANVSINQRPREARCQRPGCGENRCQLDSAPVWRGRRSLHGAPAALGKGAQAPEQQVLLLCQQKLKLWIMSGKFTI